MSETLPDSPALRERRERTIAVLCDHFAQDRLTLEEFESRLDSAHRALAPAQLDTLVADLIPPDAPQSVESVRPRPVAPASDNTSLIVSVMGGAERRGSWRPAARNIVVGLMGGTELDFREAVLQPGVTEVFIACCMAGVEIIVPPDLPVESNGFAFMGGFVHLADSPPASPDRPVLRINGFALMGGVEIHVRLPGESARDARRRRKEQRRLGGSR